MSFDSDESIDGDGSSSSFLSTPSTKKKLDPYDSFSPGLGVGGVIGSVGVRPARPPRNVIGNKRSLSGGSFSGSQSDRFSGSQSDRFNGKLPFSPFKQTAAVDAEFGCISKERQAIWDRAYASIASSPFNYYIGSRRRKEEEKEEEEEEEEERGGDDDDEEEEEEEGGGVGGGVGGGGGRRIPLAAAYDTYTDYSSGAFEVFNDSFGDDGGGGDDNNYLNEEDEETDDDEEEFDDDDEDDDEEEDDEEEAGGGGGDEEEEEMRRRRKRKRRV